MMLGTRSCGCCLQRYSSFCKEFHQCILLPETTLFFPVVLSEMIRQINETNKHCEVLVSCSDKEIYNCMEKSSSHFPTGLNQYRKIVHKIVIHFYNPETPWNKTSFAVQSDKSVFLRFGPCGF